MRIIPRPEWGARYASAYRNYDAPLPADEVWLHHSVTIAPDLVPPFTDDYAAIRRLEQIGQDRFGWGMSYTWPITPAGLLFQGHRVDGVGTHTGGRNSRSRAICFVGNYEDDEPTDAQLATAAWLLRHAKAKGWIKYARLNGGHRDAPQASTACPGRYAYAAIDEINRRAAAPIEEDEVSAAELWGHKIGSKTAEERLVLNGNRALRAHQYGARNSAEIRALAELSGVSRDLLDARTKEILAELDEAEKRDLADDPA